MNDQVNSPNPETGSSFPGEIKPWEQRLGPGMGGGGGARGRSAPEPAMPDRLIEKLLPMDMREIVDDQTSLAYYPMVDRFSAAQSDTSQKVDSNEQAWLLFTREQLFATRRVTLEHFHLFDNLPGEGTPSGFAPEEG